MDFDLARYNAYPATMMPKVATLVCVGPPISLRDRGA